MTDAHSLAGAYAVDALDDIDRAAFERHLTGCDMCRQEVDELVETTARLGIAAAEPPPPALRDRVLAAVDVTPQVRSAPSRTGGAWGRVAVPAVAAAVAVLVTLAAVGLNRQEDPRAVAFEELAALLTMPGAEAVPMEADGFTATMVSAPDSSRAVVLAEGLAQPDDGVYVLWAYRDGVPVNEDALIARDGAAAVVVDEVGGVSQVAVTVEPRGDIVDPTGPVVAQAEL